MICPNCGLENNDRNVCRKCGTFLRNKQTQRVTDPKQLKEMKRAKVKAYFKGCGLSFLLMAAAFIILSVLLFIILFFVTKNLDWPVPEDPSAVSSDSSELPSESGGANPSGPTVSFSEGD